MKRTLLIIFTSIFLLGSFIFLPSCDPDNPWFEPLDSITPLDNLGWRQGEEDLSGIEDDINFGTGTLPTSVDLSANFPPIGDQGQYGTCVAWAVGYNHKSYMDARSNARTTFTSSQMYSPKYLFWAVPSAAKGADCNGTGFEPAYDVMLSSGIADLNTTPYTSLGDCSGSTASWDGAAASNKILSYREVDIDKNELKKYLAQGRALSFGAKLGDNFMAWNSNSVHTSDTYGYSGQHAYHAMILCGYDDSKGSNGAFRVVNSWGTGWGDGGYIWVDYNFFVSEFAFCAFAATNFDDPEGDPVTTGTDLTAWEFELNTNVGGDPLVYEALYNVWNTGTTTINATEDWNILLIYYNAFDAEDWEIVLFDYYTDDYGTPAYPANNGDMGSGDGISNWWNYVNVGSGNSVADELYQTTGGRFSWQYTMPTTDSYGDPLTGDYYLVIIADGYDDIEEIDEDNNYFFMTDAYGEPIRFVNGEIDDVLAKNLKNAKRIPSIGDEPISPTARTENNLNSYTRDEIISMIKYHKETGKIAEKANKYLQSEKSKQFKKVYKKY